MACGYAMFTDRLGVCFATVGPGAFNLFSGLAVAMSDSYPVLAITGYVATRVAGPRRGQRHVRPERHAGLAGDVRRDDEEVVPASPTSTTRATCSRRPSTWPSRAGPGRCTSHVPQNLTHRGVKVENYRDVRLQVAPVRPDPAQVEAIADALAEALQDGRRVVAALGFGAVRSHARGEPCGASSSGSRSRCSRPWTARASSPERHPLARRRVLGERPLERLEGVPRGRRRARDRQLAQPARDLRPSRRPVRRQGPDPGQHLGDEIGKTTRPDHALVSDARLAVEAITEALEQRVGEVEPGRSRRPGLGGAADPASARQDPPGPAGADDRAHAAADDGDAARRRGRAPRVDGVLRRARGRDRTSARCGAFGPMSAHTNAAIGVKLAHPGSNGRGRVRRRLLLDGRASS